jgi:hypothetical protein
MSRTAIWNRARLSCEGNEWRITVYKSIPMVSALVSGVGTFGVGSSRMSLCAAFWKVC